MIQSNVYQITRTELARLASEEYLAQFWWFVAAVPAFGLVAIIFADGALRVIGGMAVLWPFSIPARSVVSTSKSSRLFNAGCHVELSDGQIRFIGEYRNGKRLRYTVELDRIKEVRHRRDMLLVRTRLPGFLPIRANAFATETDRNAFISEIEASIAARGEEPAVSGDQGAPG